MSRSIVQAMITGYMNVKNQIKIDLKKFLLIQKKKKSSCSKDVKLTKKKKKSYIENKYKSCKIK